MITLPEDAALIVGPSWVGDMVMAQALFKVLKQEQPQRQLDVLAPEWSLPIVARMPEVRCGIAAQTGHGEFGWRKRRAIAKALQQADYSQAIVLPRSLKAALVPWLARIPTRTGFRGESRYVLINDVRPFDAAILDQTVKRYAVLADNFDPADAVPHPQLTVDADNQRAVLDRLKLATELPIVAFMPGAEYGPAKCWPLPQFAELANLLQAAGFAVWIFGSEKDRAAGEAIASQSQAVNLCGRTSLEDVIDLLALCRQTVSNDSGLMHIAAAVGTHVQAIYGSSSPAFTPPLTGSCDIHYLGLECSPCFKRECPLTHLNCLRQISAQSVFQKIA